MNDIEKQIQTLERKSSSKEEVAKLNSNVASQTEQLLKSNADTAVKLGELTTKMEQLEAKLEDTNRRLSQLSQQIAETQGDLARHAFVRRARVRCPARGGSRPEPLRDSGADTTVVRPQPSGGRPPLPSSTTRPTATTPRGATPWRSRASRTTSIAYPNTDLSDNAQYWIGESLYAQKKYKEAIAAFDKLLKQWPRERQGRGRAPEEGLRPDRARPEGRGRRPAPVRHPRIPVGGGSPTRPASD